MLILISLVTVQILHLVRNAEGPCSYLLKQKAEQKNKGYLCAMKLLQDKTE